jgi:Xaa-Pro aminopeptidase
MQQRPIISDDEFFARIRKTQEILVQENVDILLAYGNEAEPQFARYYSDYWPSFEGCGVVITRSGDPILLVGPESMTFARDRSRIPVIKRLAAFRESSNPEYPGHILNTFDEILEELGITAPEKVAIAGINIIPHFTFDELNKSLQRYSAMQIISGDDLVMRLRMIKSDDEIACMRYARQITAKTFNYVLNNIKPGMTELQVRGIAVGKMYELGAEDEAYPNWILAGDGGNQAISRARHKVLGENEIIHLQIGARYEGYASTIGRPVVFGKAEQWIIDAIRAGYDGYNAVLNELYAGNNAANVAKARNAIMHSNGYADWLLYGPCHATGLMEGEPPWIEDGSDFELKKNMCFCICFFMGNQTGTGFRIEDSVRIAQGKADNMTNYRRDIILL